MAALIGLPDQFENIIRALDSLGNEDRTVTL